ncbi:hypothetical protein B0H16DRAFT_727472 [Mycena metata]|uniref:Glycan binding protein Y3-like domain-containing protein n=1 Tax=Mycena metata TaxID=1033252 RepID=A0AAD7K9N6_9AGAR|nr:hypothetical protein B0H16DRAFT_727472 [Mycena metata]
MPVVSPASADSGDLTVQMKWGMRAHPARPPKVSRWLLHFSGYIKTKETPAPQANEDLPTFLIRLPCFPRYASTATSSSSNWTTTQTLAIAALVSIPASLAQLVICNDAGTVGSCNQFITTFCTSISTVPIAGGDSASRCFTGPGTAGLKCDFTAVNTQNETTHIDLNNCEAALTAAGNQCPLGGSGQFSNGTAVFKYFNDPNTGACAPPCGN